MTAATDHGRSTEVARLLLLLRRTSADVECLVEGGSMGRAIPDGASVRIRLDGASGALPQTAVAMLLGGDTFSIHRLVKRGRSPRARGFVITHGDGNVFCDAPQREAELIGTVVAVRFKGDHEWRAVPPPELHGLLWSLLRIATERTVGGVLELSPWLSVTIKNAVVLAIAPLVWLRPYKAGQARSTSRLAGASQIPPG